MVLVCSAEFRLVADRASEAFDPVVGRERLFRRFKFMTGPAVVRVSCDSLILSFGGGGEGSQQKGWRRYRAAS